MKWSCVLNWWHHIWCLKKKSELGVWISFYYLDSLALCRFFLSNWGVVQEFGNVSFGDKLYKIFSKWVSLNCFSCCFMHSVDWYRFSSKENLKKMSKSHVSDHVYKIILLKYFFKLNSTDEHFLELFCYWWGTEQFQLITCLVPQEYKYWKAKIFIYFLAFLWFHLIL